MSRIDLGHKGFTLIEIMIALSVLMLGILGFLKLLYQSHNLSSFATRRNLAVRIAHNQIDPESIPSESFCELCDINGFCKDIGCNSTTTGLLFKVNKTIQTRSFQLPVNVGQLSENNSTISIYIADIKVGWGGNSTRCINDINSCSNNVTIKYIMGQL